jgi:2'-5' RNA ligase
MMGEMETAVVIAFSELAPIVDAWRERTCEDRPSIGVPPHVTLLYPFVPTETVEDTLHGLRELFGATPGFDVTFRELRRWPEMAYLAPEPREPFALLTEAIVERWPDYPPYEGIHETVIPHLTVAYGDDALLAEVEADVRPNLPVDCRVTNTVLLEEVKPNLRWRERARFPLALVTR